MRILTKFHIFLFMEEVSLRPSPFSIQPFALIVNFPQQIKFHLVQVILAFHIGSLDKIFLQGLFEPSQERLNVSLLTGCTQI